MKANVASSLLIVTSLALGACASDGKQAAGGGESVNYDSQLKAVENAFAEADKKGASWVFTSEFIENAKKAAAAGKQDEALKLLAKAKFEVEAANKQFEEQQKAGPVLF